MSPRAAAWIAWSMWALCLPFVAFSGGVLGFISSSTRIYPGSILIVLITLLAFTFTTVGALVASRRSENPIGWIFCAGGLFLSVVASATNYAEYAPHTSSPGSLPGVEYAAWIAAWAPLPTLFLIATMLFLLFPDGKVTSPEWIFVAWTAVIGGVMAALGEALGRRNAGTDFGSIGNPVAVDGALGHILDGLGNLGFVLLALSCVGSIAAPFV